jgi:hypothetical protein
MAQTAALPIDEPVAKPQADPRQFGSVGATIADMGQETEQLAAANSEFEGYLFRAQNSLKAKQAEIAFDRVKNQVYNDLNKATTPEDAQAAYERSKGELDNVLAPFESNRVLARELAIYRQQEDVELQHTVNAKKADIITKADHAANQVLGEKSLQTAITTKVGGGDPSIARTQFDMQLQSSVHNGTLLPQQHDAMMQQWDKDYQKGVILAKINSGDPATRQYAIKQLSSGGGELEHSMLSAEELGQLRTHAVDTDHSLTEKEEAGSLNGALNVKAEAFASPEYKHPDGTPDYEAREKSLQDPEWLKSHGIVTPDGKPNYVMAEKMQEDDARQWQMHQKVQRDKDEEVLEKYSPVLYDPKHPLTIAQIEALPQTDGASSRAVNQLKTALFQEQRNARVLRNEERSLNLEERRQKRQELEDRSTATSLNLANRMANGDVLDYNNDILTPISKGQMTEADGAKVWRMYKDSDQFPEIGEGVGMINDVFKAMPKTPENDRKAVDAHDALLKAVRDKNLHGADILQEAQRIAEGTGRAATKNFIERIWDTIASGPIAAGTSAPIAAPAKIYARDPDGKLHEAAPGTALPPGWKLESK